MGNDGEAAIRAVQGNRSEARRGSKVPKALSARFMKIVPPRCPKNRMCSSLTVRQVGSLRRPMRPLGLQMRPFNRPTLLGALGPGCGAWLGRVLALVPAALGLPLPLEFIVFWSARPRRNIFRQAAHPLRHPIANFFPHA